MRYVYYVRLAIMVFKLLQVLFAKKSTPESRETAIKTALETTNTILPNTKQYTDDITKSEVSSLAEIADILNEWSP